MLEEEFDKKLEYIVVYVWVLLENKICIVKVW